jgi:hypothetical protein
MSSPQAHQQFSLWRHRPQPCRSGKTKADAEQIANDIAEFNGEIQVLPSFPERPPYRSPHKGCEVSMSDARYHSFPRGWCNMADAARLAGESRWKFSEKVAAGVYPPAQVLNIAGRQVKAWKKVDIKAIKKKEAEHEQRDS